MGLLPMVEEYGTFAGMNREYVIAKLREHEPELKAAGIVHLRLHGSLTRGAATATPDVDLIAESTPRNSPCSIWSALRTASVIRSVLRWTFLRNIRLKSRSPSAPRPRPCVPFREPALSLRDIAEAIDAIKRFTQSMDAAAFREDAKPSRPWSASSK